MITMKNTKKEILNLFAQSSKIIDDSKLLSTKISYVVNLISKQLKKGNKLIIFGNGGSAADAQHMAAEFVGRYLIDRQSLPAIAMTTDSSILTSVGNDYSFDKVFSRQCESIVQKGDVVIAISTSGRSQNVINGIKESKKRGAVIIGLTGKGGNLGKLCDVLLDVPATQTPRIQEAHRTIIHIICELVEQKFKK